MANRIQLKKLHWLLIKTFIGPFLATFVVSVFLFLMQSLWKYLTELIGKGIEFLVILEFISYLIPHVLPYALPLTILISSTMAFGNLGERYELVAIKSAGIGLTRMMMPLLVIMVMLSGVTYYTANVLIPKANLQWGALLYDMVKKKPAMNITDGVFFKGIDGYSIRVGKKHDDNKTLEDVLIYAKADDNLTNNVIVAKRGHMEYTDNEKFLLLELYDGTQYSEMVNAREYHKTMPHNLMKFEKYFLAIDLSDLELTRTNPNAFKDDYRMLNVDELNGKLDSFDHLINKRKMYLSGFVNPFFHFERDSGETGWPSFEFDTVSAPYFDKIAQFEPQKVQIDSTSLPATSLNSKRKGPTSGLKTVSVQQTVPRTNQEPMDEQVLQLAIRNARNLHAEVENARENIDNIRSTRARYDNEKQKKYALAFSCILLFFIGAPLGAIIRRGGFGVPLVLGFVFFIIYYIMNEIGAKMARQGVIEVWVGVWLSTMVLGPIGLWLTYKANSDSKVFVSDFYKTFFSSRIWNKHLKHLFVWWE